MYPCLSSALSVRSMFGMYRIGLIVSPSTVPSFLQLRYCSTSGKEKNGKGIGFTEKDVDVNKLDHPYWDSMEFDDTFFMDEIFGEFESEYDFDLPQEDTPYLENEWHTDSKKKK